MSWLDTFSQGLLAFNTIGTGVLAVLHNSNSKKLQGQGDKLGEVLNQVNQTAQVVVPIAAQVAAAVQPQQTTVQKVEAVAEQLAPVAAAVNPEAASIMALISTLAKVADSLNAHTAALQAATPVPAPVLNPVTPAA